MTSISYRLGSLLFTGIFTLSAFRLCAAPLAATSDSVEVRRVEPPASAGLLKQSTEVRISEKPETSPSAIPVFGPTRRPEGLAVSTGIGPAPNESIAPESSSSGIEFVGTEGATIFNASQTADLTAQSICNYSNESQTGTLRLELWALSQPYSGGSFTGYRLAVSPNLSSLAKNFCYNNYDSGAVSLLSCPPNGNYYAYLFLAEYTNSGVDDGFFERDWAAFTKTLNVSNCVFTFNTTPPPPPPPPPPPSGGSPLYLHSGRYTVTASWQTSSGSGNGTPIPLTDDTGAFWFFSSTNYELLIKVLNACSGSGGYYWVFAGGLTNVRVTLTVTDTFTGVVRTYTNPLNTAFQPIQDTSAFATCP